MGDSKRSSTNEAAAVRDPVKLPSWHGTARLSDLFRFRGKRRPLATAKADHADAYTQPPLLVADELAAATALRNPVGKVSYGFAQGT